MSGMAKTKNKTSSDTDGDVLTTGSGVHCGTKRNLQYTAIDHRDVQFDTNACGKVMEEPTRMFFAKVLLIKGWTELLLGCLD